MAKERIDEITKQKVIEAHSNGLPMRRIAKECGVSLSSVSRIVKEGGSQKGQEKKGKRQKRIEELEKRIAELEKKILDLKSKKRS